MPRRSLGTQAEPGGILVSGVATTFELLGATANESATRVLVAALDSPEAALRDRARDGLLARRRVAGQLELLRRWHAFSPAWQATILEQPRRIAAGIREAALADDRQTCVNACDAAIRMREYDLVPTLLSITEDAENPHQELAAQTLLRLAQMLDEECKGSPDRSRRRDPQMVVKHVLASLDLSVQRFDRHHRADVLETFLILTDRDHPTLRRLLANPLDKAYRPISEILAHSPRESILRLIVSLLDDPDPPTPAITTASRRADLPFLRRLLTKIGSEPTPRIRASLKRISVIGWVGRCEELLSKLNESQQHSVVQMVVHSGMKRDDAFSVLRHVLEQGAPAGRRAAVRALVDHQGADANQLVLNAINDPDPGVQALALRQIRERGIPHAISRLVERLESPDEEVRQAVRESLADFDFPKYLANFDLLDDDLRKTTGALVRKVDPRVATLLGEELASPSRVRRLRALAVAPTIGVVQELEESLLEILHDTDHFLRAEAARALGQCATITSREALANALNDRNSFVQETAKESLAVVTRALRQQTDRSDTVPYDPTHRT